ncbi:MAG: hypothetical protein CMI61_15770 [Parvibaculum sp.]|nr:hypothetical protein [Parvibaculum sp.]
MMEEEMPAMVRTSPMVRAPIAGAAQPDSARRPKPANAARGAFGNLVKLLRRIVCFITHAPKPTGPNGVKIYACRDFCADPSDRALARAAPLNIAGQPLRWVKIMGFDKHLCQRETGFVVNILTAENMTFSMLTLRSARIHATRLRG